MSETDAVKLVLPYPPSANRYWRIWGGRVVRSSEARSYKIICQSIATVSRHPKIAGDVAVTVVLHPKKTKKGEASKTRIDLDNALKVVIDAMQGVAYANDSQVVRIVAEIGCPLTDGGLTIEVKEAA